VSAATGTPTVARAVKWNAVTTVARFALQLGAQVTLARLLGPGNFGVYGIGMAFFTFAAFLSGGSFSWGLMLMPRVTAEDIRFSVTWQLVAGLGSAAVMYAAAPAAAVFFKDPRLQAMVEWIALASLLTAAAAPATCLLQRELNFKALGLIQLASYAVGYLIVGIPMALHGFGANALAVACVVQAAVALVLSFSARPHPVRPLFSYPGARATLTTGRAVFFTNVVNWLLNNLDRVIIGRVLNSTSVGLYSVAYNLASIPNTLLLGTLQPTLMAVGSSLQQDRHRLSRAWQQALAVVLVLVTPAAVVAALLSADVVRFLYGAAWSETSWILAMLFLCLPAWACWGLSTPVLWNTGRQHQEFSLQLPLLPVAAGAWYLLAHEGVRAVAAASVAIIVVRALVIVGAALKALGLRWSIVGRHALRGVCLSLLCGTAVVIGRHTVTQLDMPLVSLLAGSALSLATGLLMVVARPQWLGRDAQSALCNLFPRLGPYWAPVPASTGSGG
jgi:lipopolysaccharide exporter